MSKSPDAIRNFVVEKLKEKGLSLNSVSLRLGKNATYLFKYINHKTPQRLPEVQRKQLAAILEVDEQELSDIDLNYEPPFITAVTALHDKVADLFHKPAAIVKIDMIDATACCGNGIENLPEKVCGQWQLPISEFKSITPIAPEYIKMLRVQGDSMIPTLNDGDWVLVDVSNNFISSDGLYLIRMSTGLAVKRLQAGLSGIAIKSDNPSYSALSAEIGEVQIVGKVVYILNGRRV